MRLARWACPAFFDLLPLTPTWSPRAYLGARGAQSAQPPCQSQPSQGGDASRPKGGWLGFWVSCWVLWGEGQAPIQWDSETLRCSTVSHCVMTCVCAVCVCVCVCVRARARVCAYARPCGSTRYELLPQTCPCLFPARIWGDGYTWQAWGAEQSGQLSLGTLSCPLLPTMPGHARLPGQGWGVVERGSHHSPVASLSVTVCLCACVCVSVCALWTVTVRGSCDRRHAETVRSTDSGARLPGFRS